MRKWLLRGRLRIDETVDEIEAAYGNEVGWAQGLRINVDARLVLVGFKRLLATGLIKESEMENAAVILACQLGSMESYESFDNSVIAGHPAPLAFANALPSIPLASASVRHGLRGLTCTLTGGPEVALRALRVGARLIESRRAQLVIVGCWQAPSETARLLGLSPRQRLLFAILEDTRLDSGRRKATSMELPSLELS